MRRLRVRRELSAMTLAEVAMAMSVTSVILSLTLLQHIALRKAFVRARDLTEELGLAGRCLKQMQSDIRSGERLVSAIRIGGEGFNIGAHTLIVRLGDRRTVVYRFAGGRLMRIERNGAETYRDAQRLVCRDVAFEYDAAPPERARFVAIHLRLATLTGKGGIHPALVAGAAPRNRAGDQNHD